MIRTPYPYKASLALGIIAALGAAGSAHAQTFGTTVVAPTHTQVFQFTTTTDPTTSPTYNRVAIAQGLNDYSKTTPGSSGIGSAVAYATSPTFTPMAAGNGSYTINTSATGFDAGNYIQYIYQPTLVPTTAMTALQGVKYGYYPANDSNSGSYNVTLTGATPYQFVDTGFYSPSKYPQTPGNGFYSEGTATTTVIYNNLGSQTNIPDPTRTIIPADPVTGAPATAVYTPTPISQTLSVTDPTTITSFNGITIVGLSHPVIGDLLCTLSHNGTTVDLFDHTGANSSNYNQGSQAGFNGGNYTFSLSGADLSAVPDFTDAPNSTYKATSNTATGFDTMNTANTLNSFVGMSAAGAWTLTFTDEQPDDTGSFLGFNFTINQPAAAPEPSQYAAFGIGLLGLGALALRARRRSRTA